MTPRIERAHNNIRMEYSEPPLPYKFGAVREEQESQETRMKKYLRATGRISKSRLKNMCIPDQAMYNFIRDLRAAGWIIENQKHVNGSSYKLVFDAERNEWRGR